MRALLLAGILAFAAARQPASDASSSLVPADGAGPRREMHRTTQGLPMLVVHTLSDEEMLVQAAALERRERLGLTEIGVILGKTLKAGYNGFLTLKTALSDTKSVEAAILLEAGTSAMQAKLEIKGTIALELDTTSATDMVKGWLQPKVDVIEALMKHVLGLTSFSEVIGKAMRALLAATGLGQHASSGLLEEELVGGLTDLRKSLSDALKNMIGTAEEWMGIEDGKLEKELVWSIEASYDLMGVFKLWPEVTLKDSLKVTLKPFSEDDGDEDDEDDEDEKATKLLNKLWGVGGAALLGTECGTNGLCGEKNALLTKTLLSKTMQYCMFEQEYKVTKDKKGEPAASFAFKVEHLPAFHVPSCGYFFANVLFAIHSGKNLVELPTSIYPTDVVGKAPVTLPWADIMISKTSTVLEPLTYHPQYACLPDDDCGEDEAATSFSCVDEVAAIEKAISYAPINNGPSGHVQPRTRKLFQGKSAMSHKNANAELQHVLKLHAHTDPFSDEKKKKLREGGKNLYPKMKEGEWHQLRRAYVNCLSDQKLMKNKFIKAVDKGIKFNSHLGHVYSWKVRPMKALDLTTGFGDGMGGDISIGRDATADALPTHFSWLGGRVDAYLKSGVRAALEIEYGKVQFSFGYGAKISTKEDDGDGDKSLERNARGATRARLERLIPASRRVARHQRIQAEVDSLERLLEA